MGDAQLSLIPHAYQGETITLRARDGYINATAMCKAAGKQFKHYNANETTRDFIKELSAEVGIPTAELIQSLSGGNPALQGTWIHPQVAIHLAQWLSPKFAVRVTKWVYDWMSDRKANAWQQFEDRVSLVYDSVPDGYFCVFKEVAPLYATLLAGNAHPGTRMILDISVGSHWAKHWDRAGLAMLTGDRIKYPHAYPSYFPQSYSNPQEAWCYPDAALVEFRRWMREVYQAQKLEPYLNDQVRQGRLASTEAANTMAALQNRGSQARVVNLRGR